MKILYLICLLLALHTSTGAQNLVLNGSFDQMIGCPVSVSMIDSTAFWTNPTLNGTPDYFHPCSSPFFAGVPVNNFGYQQPYTGESYAGIHRYLVGQINYREYLQGQLANPLVAGQCYFFEMYISLSNFSKYTSPDIGVLFTDSALTGSLNTQMLALTPQIINPSNMLPDTASWMPVTGTYTASGGENFLVIGNFVPDASLDTTLVNPLALWPMTYVYVDDVSLSLCTAIENMEKTDWVHVFPNPAKDRIFVESHLASPADLIIFDITSTEVLKIKFTGNAEADISSLEPGLYFYTIANAGSPVCGKFIKL